MRNPDPKLYRDAEIALEHDAMPPYLETELTHWIPPSFLTHETEGQEAVTEMPSPHSRVDTHRFITREADALKRHEDVLRGDFTRFERALARLRKDYFDH